MVVASALADAFETDVNGLPLSLDLSWLEQKAVAVSCVCAGVHPSPLPTNTTPPHTPQHPLLPPRCC